MPTAINTFRNVRTRLCRASTGTWLAGWMGHLAPSDARIRLNAFMVLRAGERFVGECYGNGAMVRFEGVLLAQMGQEIAMRIDAPLTYGPSTETIRVQVQSFEARLLCADETIRLLVMDASPKSFGGLADGPLTPGATVSVIAATPDGEIEAQVKVMNCYADTTQAGYFRVGFMIESMGRLDAARWSRLIEEWIEA